MAWQRRNGGHNSSTGHGAVMGAFTGKILDYGTRCKLCRFCDSAAKKGKNPKTHDCRRNHVGSSKSMEPNVAVDLFQRAVQSKIKYNVYTGDDDATTQSHIREKVSYEVEKQSDVIHTKRSLLSKLYALKSQQKFPGCSSLSVKVISYLAKCFGYCVAQNKNNPQSLQTALRNIIPHAFGRHENCNEAWCQFKKDPLTYRHGELPFGKDLHGDDLEKALTKVFEDYSTDIVVKKLAPATSSQRNESFNNVVGSRNIKIRFYGGSESNDFRVACGVSQTNEGHSFVCKTLKEVNIEPDSHCTTYNEAADVKSLQEKIRKSTISFKKKRSQLHRSKLSSNARSEAKEGTTYETNVGLNLDATKDNSITKLLKSAEQLDKIRFQEYERMVPPFKTRPTQPKISYNEAIRYQFVVFDIETTGLSKQTQICQLAAVTKEGKTYNEYVLPTCDIDHRASRINKLSVKVVNGQRTLLKESVPVQSVLLSQCLQNFTTFLLNDNTDCHTILIGHNSSVFDTPTLLRCAGPVVKELLSSNNVFFADSLPLVRALIKAVNPSLNPEGKACKINLPAVFQTVFNEQFAAHDALEDVLALRRVLFQSSLKLTVADIVNNSNVKSTSFAYEDMQFLDERLERMQTFKNKLNSQGDDGLVKQTVIQKIAESGISYQDLFNIFTEAGKEALVAILCKAPTNSTSSRSTPRGTKHPATLAKIIEHFDKK